MRFTIDYMLHLLEIYNSTNIHLFEVFAKFPQKVDVYFLRLDLVGSSAFSCYRDNYGSLNIITGDYPASKARAGKSDSYIVWKTCPTNV